MHCMDCLTADQRTAAIGICTQCGAAALIRTS
jgi:hypothetical protein